MARKTVRSLNDASAWAQAQGIMTQDEWDARTKMDGWPADIPRWAHFLATDHPRARDVDTAAVDDLVTA